MLDVGDGIWIYAEGVGSKGGVSVLFLHGGPASGSQQSHRALFDTKLNHAILFDQRGAGRSHPHLSVNANTTAHLIGDIERLREFFKFEKWIVTGGSWGATLALAYAQAHPERIAALVLRAVFLGTSSEVEWAFIEGPKRFRPELYQSFVGALPSAERADALAAYIERLNDLDPGVHGPAANVWYTYEHALSALDPRSVMLPRLDDQPARIPPTPIMEAHYISNSFFLKDDQLLTNANRLVGILGILVQGRYDLLCPPSSAHALCKPLHDCDLRFVEGAGHAISEPGILPELQAAIASFTARCRS
jgi:proline iminopeptidase